MKFDNFFSEMGMYIMKNVTGLDRRLKHPNYEDERPRMSSTHKPFRILVEELRLARLLARVTWNHTATLEEWVEYANFSDLARRMKDERIATKKIRNSRKGATRHDSPSKSGARTTKGAGRRNARARGSR